MRTTGGSFSVAVAIATLAVACGDDPSAAGDGDAGSDAGGTSAPVSIPWLADGVPPLGLAGACPDGWRETFDADGLATCDPYPEGGPGDCAFGDAHFPGEPGCRPIGDPCPAGDFAEGLPTDGSVVYVRAGATGGDGSLAAPFGALSEVPWATRGIGSTVALAKGTYPGVIPLRAGARVVGACVAETRLTGLAGPSEAVVVASSAGPASLVRNVAIVDAPQFAVLAGRGRALDLEGVLVLRASWLALVTAEAGSVLRATDVVVEDTRPGTTGIGRGVEDSFGARFEATRLVVSGATDGGIFANNPDTTAVLTDVVVRDTRPRVGTLAGGRGLVVQGGARVDATRLLASNNREAAVVVIGAATVVTLHDALLRDTQPVENDRTAGRGINVQDGARLEAERVVISGAYDVGVYATHPDTFVSLASSLVRDVASRASDGESGRGISVQLGAQLEATNVIVSHVHDVGVFVSGAATTTVLTDVSVHDVSPRDLDATGGYGVVLQGGPIATAARLRVADVRELGIGVSLASFTGNDVVVERVLRSACDCPERGYGYGAMALGSTLSLTGFGVAAAQTCGLLVAPWPEFEAALDVRTGVVEGADVGACVQVDGYDLARLSTEVLYRDNGTNLAATTLPVPDPTLPLAP